MSAPTAARSASAGPGWGLGLEPEALWERHGSALYAMAWVLLWEQAAAMRAVALGLVDLYRKHPEGPSPGTAMRSAAACVYQQCQQASHEVSARGLGSGVTLMDWLHDVAPLQRHTLALCTLGGHTYREAAALIGLPPPVVAQLLSSGLHELTLRAKAEPGPPPPGARPPKQ